MKRKVTTVFGEAIKVEKKEKYNDEDIYKLFEVYKSKIEELFNKYKGEYSNNSEVEEVLEIIE